YSPILLKHDLAEKRIRHLRRAGVPSTALSPEQFRSISLAEHVSGVGAIARQRWTPLNRASPFRGLCWLVVESLRSPGNLGTILRTAEATSVSGVIFLSSACDPFVPGVIPASMGRL